MSLDIDVVIDHISPSVEVSESDIADVVRETLNYRSVTSAVVTVVIADHNLVRDLNSSFLEHHYNTDVLSFILSDDEDDLEGEVYADLDTAVERCGEFGVTPKTELFRYVIHGVLHLTGMDDSTEELRTMMSDMEDQILEMILRQA